MNKQMNNEEQLELNDQIDETLSDEELEEVSGGRRQLIDELHGRAGREVVARIGALTRNGSGLAVTV